MALKKKKREDEEVALNMTAMVDVAFQLLIFFIISATPPDQMTQLDVSRSSPDSDNQTSEVSPNAVRIQISEGNAYTLNDDPVTLEQMGIKLKKMAKINKKESILIMTSILSRHEQLISVLDLCTSAELSSLSVMSTE